MALTSSDTRIGLRLFGGAGLVVGYAAFGMPAVLTSTWGVIGRSAATGAHSDGFAIFMIWLGLGVVGLGAAVAALLIAARRQHAARTPGRVQASPAGLRSPSASPREAAAH
ncbi:hypothetical protein RN607_05235 [Demequina capsici]|uniref:Uncharacterized protein n=1 Tax=Demequina capsici TaxID=3075620 RepID=A0AA96JBS8_9MICO|nr:MULTISPECIES: hypothetical protein [unclassified Demequina]WNM25517.1 hypothetical protein RN606_05050 [Demequina sp. OYTSA14]WNM28408.1 hypothetical protein RN607_05235 [Demequina sp. PMTSA13]